METNNLLSEKIQDLRLNQKMDRREFGEKIGVTQEYIRMLENGKRSPSEGLILAMCYRFDVTENWFTTDH